MEVAERQQVQAAEGSFWDRPLLAGIPLTRETTLYLALFIVAATMRLWDLGARMIHHDESLHSVFSWYYYIGRGYVHDPMMHGPWQFHAMALSYFLFGVSEATARLPHAISGSVLAVLPFALRRYLGRTGAFAAAVLLALSPGFLYFTRFAREDAFAVTWTAIVVVGVFRYLDQRKPADLYLATAALSLFFCTKENAYIFSGILLLGLLFLSVAHHGWEVPRFLAKPTAVVLSPQGDLLILVTTLILPLFAGFAALGARFLRLPDPSEVFLFGLMAALAFVSVIVGLRWDARRWAIAAAVFWGIFVVLYTSFFSNPGGVATGAIDAVKYWTVQQVEVARGGQPWYYYLILLPLYEFVAVIFGLAGFVYWSGRRNILALFLIYWAVTTMVLYAFTSEKMPWLIVHVALPFVLLAGMTIGKLIEGVDWARAWRGGALVYAVALLLAVVGGATLLQRPLPIGEALSTIGAQQALFQFAGLLIVFAAFVALAVRQARRLGGEAARRLAGVAALALLMAFSLRTAWQASYYHGDTPVEMLVYVQTSPDVGKVMQQIEQAAFRTGTGKAGFKVAYDSGVTWPFEWYLRDYTSKNFFGTGLPADDAPIVLVGYEHEDTLQNVRNALGSRYVSQRYKLRWWFPEELYRDLTIPAIIQGLGDPETRGKLWRFLLYRELPAQMGSTDFEMFVRRDLASGPWAAPQAVAQTADEDVYAAKAQPLTATLVFGSPGQGEGQFYEPKGVAVAPDGTIYVADTRNNRIEKFDQTGRFVLAWGGPGEEPGQFNEPWGIAVDGAGNVWVADWWNHRIQKFSPLGEFILKIGPDVVTIGNEPGQFYGPRGIAIDAQGNAYVTDTGNHRVQKFDASGKFLAQFGSHGSGDGQFSEPVGIAIDPSGLIYVADTWNRRIQKFDASFKPVGQWPVAGWEGQSVVNKPYLAVDADGAVYATDPERNRVIRYSPTGSVLAVWGKAGSDVSSLRLPIGITADRTGGILVADALNNRIARFGPVR